jgi:predicted permease
VENVLKDLQFGVRLLRRTPAFAAVAVLSLGLGIGVNTAMFSVVNAVLFAPVPVEDPTRLVEIYTSAVADMPYLPASHPDFLDLRGSTDAFTGLAAHSLVRGLYKRGQDRAELVLGEVVTDNYFELLGVRPALGRGFLPEENRTELSHPVAVLSHRFWQKRLGGDPRVLQTPVELSGVTYTVVGVAPPGFTGVVPGLEAEFWAPLMMVEKLTFNGIQSQTPSPGDTRVAQRGTRWLFVKGRLAPGRTVEEARAQVATVVARLAIEHGEVNKDLKGALLPARAVRFHPMIDGVLTPAAAILMGAVGLVLLVACANVANMLIARAAARRREIAVRMAIGAGRGRLVSQLLAESVVLASLGGLVGLGLAFWAGRVLSAVQPPLPLPLTFDFAIDLRVLAFAVLASVATTVLFGLAPALQATRRDLVAALRGTAGATGPARRGLHLRDVLAAGQMALSLVLLVAGALLLRGLQQADRIPPGFDPDRIAALSFNLKVNGYSKEQATAFQRTMVERLRALPGIEEVALVSRAPLGSDINMEGIRVPGHHGPDDPPTTIDATYVEPAYFAALGLTLKEGRGFTEDDRPGSPAVVIVNEAMARRFWPGRSPIGARIHTEGLAGAGIEVVGVVADYKVRDVGEAPRPYLHFAWRQDPRREATIVARTQGPAAASLLALRGAVLELEPAIVFSEEGTGRDVLALTLAPARAGAVLLGCFGALALVLAAIGLYGVVAYSVAQRTREVGLRMALGATTAQVMGMVVAGGMRLAAAGVAAGVLVSIGVTRVLSALLYGVSSVDPLAFAGAAGVLLAVALAANLAPARRATRIQPMAALRHD